MQIFQAPTEIAPKNYKMQIRSKVGLRLLGSTESVCEVRFNKNVYYPGDHVDIWLDCDNSKCSKAVKSYKIKLHRQLRCRESMTGHYDSTVLCLKTVKEPGCAAGKKESKHLRFMIPLMENDCSEKATNLVDRTSMAMLNKDARGSRLKLHGGDSSDEKEDLLIDLCPSWMG